MAAESNYNQEFINLSDEFEQGDREINNDLGIGRSYECVFCKRGFNTAQALGGHMNIHRKNRVKTKPAAATSNKQDQEVYNGPGFYPQLPGSNHDGFKSHHDDQPHLMNCATYFPTSSSSYIRPLYEINTYHNQREVDSLIPDDWSTRLSLEFCSKDLEMNRQVIMNQKEELDLELRLGYSS